LVVRRPVDVIEGQRSLGSIAMPWSALPLVLVLNLGPSIYWGFADAGVPAALLWSAGMGIFVVLAGWHIPQKGLFTSVWRGMWIAAVINVPAYFIGRWLALLPLDCSRLDSGFETAIKQIACSG
jgi:hypothetical protein